MKRRIKVVLLGGWFHQKTVEIDDDGDPLIELYPQAGGGETWVYKIASDAELMLLGFHYLVSPRAPRYALLVGPK